MTLDPGSEIQDGKIRDPGFGGSPTLVGALLGPKNCWPGLAGRGAFHHPLRAVPPHLVSPLLLYFSVPHTYKFPCDNAWGVLFRKELLDALEHSETEGGTMDFSLYISLSQWEVEMR